MKRLSKTFKQLYISQLCANTGDVLYIVALIGYIFKLTHSAQASVYVPIIITSAIFISGWFTPYVYSKWLKKDILLFNQTIKTILMTVMLLVMLTTDQIHLLYTLAFFNAFLDGFTNPLKMTLIPLIERDKDIGYANAQMSMMNSIVQIGSWSLGGILLILGSSWVILLTVILYLISVLYIQKLNVDQDARDGQHFFISKRFTAMLKINQSLPESSFLSLTTLFESVGHAVWTAAILLAFVSEYLHATSSWFSIINALFFSGLLLGGIILARFNHIMMKHTQLLVVVIPLLLAMLNLLFAYNHILIFALLISLIYGLFDEFRTTLMHTHIQVKLDDRALTALYTLNSMIYSLCFCISSYLMATISDTYSVITAFLVATVAYIICFVVSIFYQNIFK